MENLPELQTAVPTALRWKIDELISCPVICHDLVTALTAYGLVNASHLNGKLGAVKSYYRTNKKGVDESGFCGDSSGVPVIVHFENSSQIPAVVKPENIWIAFDLPSEGPSA